MTRYTLRKYRNSFQIKILGIAIIILVICEGILIVDVTTEIFELKFDFLEKYHETIEGTAVFFLGVTLIVMGVDFRRLVRENRQFQSIFGIASDEFLIILGGKFNDWKLSHSEQEIALLLIKGLSVQEIADIRETRPGTIKSQCSAVYRKADVKGRSELGAYFLEDFLAGVTLPGLHVESSTAR